MIKSPCTCNAREAHEWSFDTCCAATKEQLDPMSENVRIKLIDALGRIDKLVCEFCYKSPEDMPNVDIMALTATIHEIAKKALVLLQ